MLSTLKAATNSSSGPNTSFKDTNNATTTTTLKESVERLWNVSSLRKKIQNLEQQPMVGEKLDEQKGEDPSHHHVHVAVCACIVDSLPHEHIWRRWLYPDRTPPNNPNNGTCCPSPWNNLDADTTKTISYSADIHIHAKFPRLIQSQWVKQKLISRSFQPDWNDIRIVQAMLALAEEALHNPSTTHILFCTESCIPISSLQDTIRMLLLLPPTTPCTTDTADPAKGQNYYYFSMPSSIRTCLHSSFLNAYNSSDPTKFTRFDERTCWSKLSHIIPYEAIWKALPGWCVLSKKHMKLVLDMPVKHLGGKELYPIFGTVWAPEEVFFPTALSLLGVLPSDEVIRNQSLVYSHFIRGQPHPKEYDLRDPRSVEQIATILREEKRETNIYQNMGSDDAIVVAGYITLRKVKHPIDEKTWEQIINYIKSSSENARTCSLSSKNYARDTSACYTSSTKRHQHNSTYDEQVVMKRGRY
jgi:hypothetical protein